MLADFRRWLEDLAAAPSSDLPPLNHGGLNTVDLATVIGAFTALRHEVNLQTKASRAQSEQLAAAMDLLNQPANSSDEEAAVRPLVKAIVEAFDTLTRTTIEIDRLRESLNSSDAALPWRRFFFPSAVWRKARVLLPPPLRGRASAGDGSANTPHPSPSPQGRRRTETTDRLEAAVTGLRMSERRIERLMREVGVEPIETVGQPFDPETMEAVEAVTAVEQAPGIVVEEMRRGYLWDGRVFRFAQVRVAK